MILQFGGYGSRGSDESFVIVYPDWLKTCRRAVPDFQATGVPRHPATSILPVWLPDSRDYKIHSQELLRQRMGDRIPMQATIRRLCPHRGGFT